MTNKKQLLDYAFEEAVNACHLNGLAPEVAEEVLTTGMNAYAKREGFEFTAEEVHATIVAGLETINKAGEDFTLQTKTML